MPSANLITAFKVGGTTYQYDYDSLGNKPSVVTSIDDQSTNSQLPSAAAVYALVQASSGGSGGGYNYQTSVTVVEFDSV